MDVWSRQPGETQRAFAMFALYRDLGPFERSITRVAREHGRSRSVVEELSSRNGWVGRTEAWDQENERVKRNAQRAELEAMARRQILAGQLLESKALKRAQSMTDDEVNSMSIWEMLKMLETGVRLERLGRGVPPDDPAPYPEQASAPTEIVGVHLTIMQFLQRNPSRVGPVVEALAPLLDLLADLDSSPEAEGPDDLADLLAEDE